MGEIVNGISIARARHARLAISHAIDATNELLRSSEVAIQKCGEELSIADAKYIIMVREEANKVISRSLKTNYASVDEVEKIGLEFLNLLQMASKLPRLFEKTLGRR